MQKNSILNIFIQALKPNRLTVMLKKIRKRILDDNGYHSNSQNLSWLESQSSDFKELAIGLNAELWEETINTTETIESNALIVLENIEYDLGGGGGIQILYFITRYLEPEIIVETGVAAGFSSYSFLSAIKRNGRGKLYSSDFPYFRIPNPESYIGVVVDEALKENWDLFIDGDEVNLPKIAKSIDKIDIFHYDSDKSYSGRNFAISIVENLLSSNGIIVMDDIQDNSYFYDYVEKTLPVSWYVFKYQGKYIGMIGELKRTIN